MRRASVQRWARFVLVVIAGFLTVGVRIIGGAGVLLGIERFMVERVGLF